jgi:hypothetical protein
MLGRWSLRFSMHLSRAMTAGGRSAVAIGIACMRAPAAIELQVPSPDDEQQPTLAVLLLDEHGSATGADRLPADGSVSSNAWRLELTPSGSLSREAGVRRPRGSGLMARGRAPGN